MDPRLLDYYERELQFIREMGAEFADEFPKVAGRLGLKGFECVDPYVERLLEGFAFLTARVQLKLDAQFPAFTQHLLEMVYPHYLQPIPSMTVVQYQPDLTEGSLVEGFDVPRNSVMRSHFGEREQTACEYRSAHAVTLWPIGIEKVEYLSNPALFGGLKIPAHFGVKAALKIELRSSEGVRFDQLSLDSLPIYLQGSEALPMRLYELLLSRGVGVMVQGSDGQQHLLDASHIQPKGFADDEALLHYGDRSFQGYRLLQEYFAFAERYRFVELTGLQAGLKSSNTDRLEIFILLSQGDPQLEGRVDGKHFALFCTPAINLFPKRCDRIHLDEKQHEYHIVPDRTRPQDFELHSIQQVTGYGSNRDESQRFNAFYAQQNINHLGAENRGAYYSVQRHRRKLSNKQKKVGPRSSYIGSELFISLVDGAQAPYSSRLKQLSIEALCSNRDLPLQMPIGRGREDFFLESGAPVESIRCLSGPTRPKTFVTEGESSWRLISHLSLNYLSLLDSNEAEGAAALRELLMLYVDQHDAGLCKQVEGIRSIHSRSVVRQISQQGPLAFAQGVEITLTMEEALFEGGGVFLLATVLELFLGRYVSINAFTEMVLKTTERGEIKRWPLRTGTQSLI